MNNKELTIIIVTFNSAEIIADCLKSFDINKYDVFVIDNNSSDKTVEIIKNNSKAKPGEMGEVIITDLNNYCMPFLRYKIGDLAIAPDPKYRSICGRGLPIIGRIEGRVQAIIIGADNRFLPGTFFAHFFKDYPHLINQYQVIQNELGSIELKIIKGSRFTEESMNELLQQLKYHLGENTNINLNYVEKIDMVRTGKHQGAISNLNINFQSLSQEYN